MINKMKMKMTRRKDRSLKKKTKIGGRKTRNSKIEFPEKNLKFFDDSKLIMKGGGSNERLNEKFIGILGELEVIMMKHGEPFRAKAYHKAQETILGYLEDIHDYKELKGLPGIGPTILEKLKEYSETGTLKVIEREKNNPVNILADVYGIGPKKAKELVDKGINSITMLRTEEGKKHLNENQLKGLEFYEDILKKIPRSEIEEYLMLFTTVFKCIIKPSDEASFEIVGSFRRGSLQSGDIDVIVTSNSQEVFKTFIDKLIENKIIIHVLSRGEFKCLVITKIPCSGVARRVDFLFTDKKEYPFAILYFTGSKAFNTVMRHHALKNGLTMNEHGLYLMNGKKKGLIVDHSFASEKDIFDYLGLQYKKPEERIDGRDVLGVGKEFGVDKSLDAQKDLGADNEFEKLNLGVNEKKTAKNKTLKKKNLNKKILLIEEEKDDVKEVSKKKKKEDTEVIKKIKKLIPLSPTISSTSGVPSYNTPLAGYPISETIEDTDTDMVKDKDKDMDTSLHDDKSVVFIIKEFKSKGITVLERLNEDELANIIDEANKAYYNDKPLMTDNDFDIIKEYIEKRFPNNKILFEIGASVKKNKVKLPYFMGSMDKIKPDTLAIETWKKKYHGPYMVSCKLDGVSGLFIDKGGKKSLYTRGDGKYGQDISYLIPHLRLPNKKGKQSEIAIRGEFIIPKEVFNKKYKGEFANPRNMVAGIINQKKVDIKIKDIHFVAYELIEPSKKPLEQMKFLEDINIECVLYKEEKNITNEILSELLVEWRKDYKYEIDGIIVTNNEIYDRVVKNPEHSFAFKMVLSDQIAEAKVVDVLWTPSKDGYLKPRVRIEPIHLGGVTIEYATGFNGAFIKENKIGVGALIEIIRSGDVIPHIKSVTVPAEVTKMPDVPYIWNATNVDVILDNKINKDLKENDVIRLKLITGFFKGIGVDGLGEGNVDRIIDAGYNTVPKILDMKLDDFLKVEGFKMKLATKIFEGIKIKLDEASLITIMSASNIFGRGFSETKLDVIMTNLPDILTSNEGWEKKIKLVSDVKGMAKKSAEAFVEKIPIFLTFLKECKLDYKLNKNKDGLLDKEKIDVSHVLYGKNIVISGFRDKALVDELKQVGAKNSSSISKNTFVLIVKEKDDKTGKILDAEELGIPIMTLEEFKSKYL